jgi:hypothetical protein
MDVRFKLPLEQKEGRKGKKRKIRNIANMEVLLVTELNMGAHGACSAGFY